MEATATEKTTFSKWDLADYINTKEDVEGILEAALEENDTELLLAVINDIAHSKGIVQISEELNHSSENLYGSLSKESTPSFRAIVDVLNIFGFQLCVKPKMQTYETVE